MYDLLRRVDCMSYEIISRAKTLKKADTPNRASAFLSTDFLTKSWSLMRIEFSNMSNAYQNLKK